MTARCRAAGNALCELLTAAGSPEMAEAVAAEIASSVPAAGWARRRRAFSLLAAADAEAAVPAFQKVLMSEQHQTQCQDTCLQISCGLDLVFHICFTAETRRRSPWQ